jgi:hypothetical protein
MEVISGTIFKMEQGIKAKLVASGATSEAKAVTIQEADLDMQEENWLGYVAGGLFAIVKKKGNKYYVEICFMEKLGPVSAELMV